ncbi:MAG: nucleoside monophosphate kinase [Cyanobacteriota bacterium]
MERLLIIFLGPPGAGKGTLSQLCIDRLGWRQVSTGELCRWCVNEGSEIGKQMDFFIRSGKLVPEELMIPTVRAWLLEHESGLTNLIMDGFPRTVAQARALDQMLVQEPVLTSFSTCIVLLEVDDVVVEQRLMSRLICPKKGCGATYSTVELQLMPAIAGICDRCGSALITRKDDTQEVIRQRLEAYHQHRREIISYYEGLGKKVVRVNVDQPLELVFADLTKKCGLRV